MRKETEFSVGSSSARTVSGGALVDAEADTAVVAVVVAAVDDVGFVNTPYDSMSALFRLLPA
ncbi:MAG: hypothetical protein OHK0029_17810 [Armatimonadaceae bacterium]